MNTENKKLKIGVYIDGANLFYQGKRSQTKINFKKIITWISKLNDIVYLKYFIGTPFWEPAISLSKTFNEYLEKLGYTIITKPIKKIKSSNTDIKNKCNFDVEIHDEILQDLKNIDIIYLFTGDSDFMITKKRILENNKKIKFITFKKGCSWEIRKSWHVFLDDIIDEIS